MNPKLFFGHNTNNRLQHRRRLVVIVAASAAAILGLCLGTIVQCTFTGMHRVSVAWHQHNRRETQKRSLQEYYATSNSHDISDSNNANIYHHRTEEPTMSRFLRNGESSSLYTSLGDTISYPRDALSAAAIRTFVGTIFGLFLLLTGVTAIGLWAPHWIVATVVTTSCNTNSNNSFQNYKQRTMPTLYTTTNKTGIEERDWVGTATIISEMALWMGCVLALVAFRFWNNGSDITLLPRAAYYDIVTRVLPHQHNALDFVLLVSLCAGCSRRHTWSDLAATITSGCSSLNSWSDLLQTVVANRPAPLLQQPQSKPARAGHHINDNETSDSSV